MLLRRLAQNERLADGDETGNHRKLGAKLIFMKFIEVDYIGDATFVASQEDIGEFCGDLDNLDDCVIIKREDLKKVNRLLDSMPFVL